MPVSKPKVLQARRSMLDNLDENLKQTEEPPAKRPKREDENEVGVAFKSCDGHVTSMLGHSLINMYSGTSLLWTPWGPSKVSCIERCPHFRGKFLLRKHIWDIAKCP